MTETPDDPSIDAVLAGWLRGEAPGWPAGWTGEAALDRVLERIDFHGIAVVLHRRAGAAADLPERLAAALRLRRLAFIGWEAAHHRRIADLLARLAAAGCRPVLLKGTACAYSIYADPAERIRGDTDILVAPGDRDRAIAVLERTGYRREIEEPSAAMLHQAAFSVTDPGGEVHTVDLHWQFANAPVLAGLFPHAALLAGARPLPRLAPEAVGPDPVDALLIACMHREVHLVAPLHIGGTAYWGDDRLIWLEDIRLLAATLDAAGWARLAERARALGLAATTARGLRDAAAALGAAVPAAARDALERAAAARPGEPVGRYLRAGQTRRLWMNLRHGGSLAARARYLAEIAFPSRDYMASRYPGAGRAALPWLYLRRAAGGALRGLRSRGARG